jgi:hypothetical protein
MESQRLTLGCRGPQGPDRAHPGAVDVHCSFGVVEPNPDVEKVHCGVANAHHPLVVETYRGDGDVHLAVVTN